MTFFIEILFLSLGLLCWGSFLNCMAYRLVHDVPFWGCRSICPSCLSAISLTDLIPLWSWFRLKGRCRSCNQAISLLYPLIEVLTVLCGLGVYFKTPSEYWSINIIFISALLIVIRTDLETMLISRFTTLFLIPVAFVLSLTYFGYTPLLLINISDAIRGALFGYFILFIINKVFLVCTKRQGIGQGDMELLAMIGAFTGVIGAWISLLIGSLLGSVVGVWLICQKSYKMQALIPFGPFLAAGAICYTLFQTNLLNWLFY